MAALTRAQLRVVGTVRPPGDKSISHRALILAAVSRGTSRISRVLDSDDLRSTATALRMLGAEIPDLSERMVVKGCAPSTLRSPAADLDCGNSGTTARLLSGVVAGAGLTATFVGDASLSRRPMGRVAEPLRAMGAFVSLSPAGGLPMTVHGGPLRSIEWASAVASAQVKSAVMLAAVLGGVACRVSEPQRSRDHTERMLLARGVRLERDDFSVRVPAPQTIKAADVTVPADPSSAAFFVALALLADSGELRISDVCLNPTRTGFLEIVRRMADVAAIRVEDARVEGGENVGTIVVRPSVLRGAMVVSAEIPAAIDELPILACLAARATGETMVTGASELRQKESDRIAMIVSNLRAIGADADELPDGYMIRGSHRSLHGHVHTGGDHRITMAFGILAALPGNNITVDDPDCTRVSYPGFWRELARVQA